ncbi:wall-associated receptor kinase-like 1 isoform X2 [Pistacia vera]|uniref:wall-associated receptor kinase-like 1 isoform X2 n=1 Tax=Pistacia vera TaxID=55513 RepID=UPI001262BA94|nr:wall-associated receptor kinase-like 1 isoform X2 [Pistacia vera]
MKPHSLIFFFFFFFFFMYLFYQPSDCQQKYPNNTLKNCTHAPSKSDLSKGYLCNGPENTACQSFLTFHSHPPYNSPSRIARLLGSEPSSITLINGFSSNDKSLPPGTLVIVPVSCSCFGSVYHHKAAYTIRKNNTYFSLANDTFQGLTTCQALMSQNYYDPTRLVPDSELMAPLRCACPSRNQTAEGVSSLLTYMVEKGNTSASIGNRFGVDEDSILEGNMLLKNSTIYPFTPLLIPLKWKSCKKSPKYFYCYCPNGFLADGTQQGLNCRPDSKKFPVKLVTLLGVGIGLGFLCMFLLGYNLCKFLRERRTRLERYKFFKQNGGFLLQQRLSSYGRSEQAKIFTAEELQSATDDYNQSRFLGKGGFGTVYKGLLPDGSIVAVKKPNAIDKSQIEQFINEVIILSQISHRNIVKLLGCCLETEVPTLVYEFIPNGTLFHHLHDHEQESSLSCVHRLRIACDVAGAVAYMHSAASIPIFHRDIKSSNVLLDEKYSAKVSDFGTSTSIPDDKTHLTTAVRGTFGYLDPEYFQSNQFTEKSDVYSFGVVLVELLTGKQPISFAIDEEERNPIGYFIKLAKENRLLEVLDTRVAEEAEEEEIQAIAELAMRCLRLKGKKRPTMKEVAMELEGLRKSQRCIEISQDPQPLRDDDQNAYVHSAEESGQESVSDSKLFPLYMESSSF